MEIIAQVVEQYVPFIKEGMNVTVEIPALKRDFNGVVISSAPQADVRARTFPVRVKVDNEIRNQKPLLKSGMYSRVSFPVGKPQQALLVPKDAIVLGGPAPVVFVVGSEAAEKRVAQVLPVPVELGLSVGSLIQVNAPITAEQLVVVEGNERLMPQQKVNVAAVKPIPPQPQRK